MTSLGIAVIIERLAQIEEDESSPVVRISGARTKAISTIKANRRVTTQPEASASPGGTISVRLGPGERITLVTSNVDLVLFGDHVLVGWKEAGLLFPSLVTGILRTIKSEMIYRKLGSIAPREMKTVDLNLQ